MKSTASPLLEKVDSGTARDVRECADQWKDKEGNLIMILHEIQNRMGFVPREASLLLAEETGVPVARIYEVLTFYHYFKLVAPGENNITLCNGTACYLKGVERILTEFERRLGIKDGQTSEDRLFHIETVRCIGCCGMAPVMVVNGRTMGKAVPTDVAGLIEEIRKQGGDHE
ncbi:MAG: NAD(P)H-dependent oxidoreductase subunit E [Opitutales bacterium]